jgi:hypothetical protein
MGPSSFDGLDTNLDRFTHVVVVSSFFHIMCFVLIRIMRSRFSPVFVALSRMSACLREYSVTSLGRIPHMFGVRIAYVYIYTFGFLSGVATE